MSSEEVHEYVKTDAYPDQNGNADSLYVPYDPGPGFASHLRMCMFMCIPCHMSAPPNIIASDLPLRMSAVAASDHWWCWCYYTSQLVWPSLTSVQSMAWWAVAVRSSCLNLFRLLVPNSEKGWAQQQARQSNGKITKLQGQLFENRSSWDAGHTFKPAEW